MIRQKFANLKGRSAGLLVALLIVAGGVAFALLQSQAKLTGNSISTQSAGLLISQNDTNYGQTTTGYSFANIIPGSQSSQTEHFMLKNTGTSPLALKISVTSVPANPSNIDLTKVHVILTPYSTVTYMPGTSIDYTLQSLVDAGSTGAPVDYPSPLAVGTKEEFNIKVAMDADAVNGANASLSNIDLGFTGVASN